MTFLVVIEIQLHTMKTTMEEYINIRLNPKKMKELYWWPLKLLYLIQISNSKKIINTAISFVDIAGLVKGASKGEGLGNQFLANIREVYAIEKLPGTVKGYSLNITRGMVKSLFMQTGLCDRRSRKGPVYLKGYKTPAEKKEKETKKVKKSWIEVLTW